MQIGSLGLPGTRWADGEKIDARTQARGLCRLLPELVERGEVCINATSCVVFMGLGPGASAVLHFAETFRLDNKFANLREATRFLALVNPLPITPLADSKNDPAVRSLQILRKNLYRGARHEQLHSLATAMFSSEHLKKVRVSCSFSIVAPTTAMALNPPIVRRASGEH